MAWERALPVHGNGHEPSAADGPGQRPIMKVAHTIADIGAP